MHIRFVVALVLMMVTPACQAQQPVPPLTNGQATKAAQAELGLDRARVVLGTCKPALRPHTKGQTACTLLVVFGAGTSETQADFSWNGKEWVFTPSSSQSILPFPDPVLMNIHVDTKIDPNAGPIR